MATRASHPLLKRVGARIRKFRTAKGLSQEGLAHACDMDRSYISGLERGEYNVSLVKLARVATVLRVRVSHLIESD